MPPIKNPPIPPVKAVPAIAPIQKRTVIKAPYFVVGGFPMNAFTAFLLS
jgi:hypothetical protein